ncbi:cytochrome c biogenesis CcdA family protein [Chloroflexota bacterium]
MEDYSLAIAFSAGLLSLFSPCILPLVPVYIANMVGASALGQEANRRHYFLNSLSFVLGFSLVFTGLGASAGLIGRVLPASTLNLVAGSVMVFFGVFMLAARRIARLNYELRLSQPLGNSAGYLRSTLTGAAFAMAWTPCVGPILGGILILASSSQTAWEGAYLLMVYSLGLGIPFIAIGLALGSTVQLVRWISRNGNIIAMLSGSMLILLGILILTDRFISIGV